MRLGLVAIGAAAALGTYLQRDLSNDLWSTFQARYAMGAASLAIFVTLIAIAVNLFIGGTLAIVTGARGLSMANPRTRKGGAIMWLGAEALAVGVIVGQFPSSRNDVFVEWSDATAPVALALVALGLLLTRTGWKYDVRGARDVLLADTRPPVIYLRSFKDDVRSPIGGAFGWWLKALSWFMPVSFEQELAAIMNRLGPFVAVGKPGERLPELGANRFYFRDDEWQARVGELVQQARLTLILCGQTANLWWEIDHVLGSVEPNRVLLLIPERGAHSGPIEAQLEARLGYPGTLTDRPATRSAVASLMVGGDRAVGRIIYFSENWRPHVQPIVYARSVSGSVAMLRRPFSLYSAPLEAAFEPVFAALQVPWTPAGPNRTVAIVLAATLGVLGLHHLYLGDRRRAVKYAVFFWTGVPVVLAIRDAIRLVLMDQAAFEREYRP